MALPATVARAQPVGAPANRSIGVFVATRQQRVYPRQRACQVDRPAGSTRNPLALGSIRRRVDLASDITAVGHQAERKYIRTGRALGSLEPSNAENSFVCRPACNSRSPSL